MTRGHLLATVDAYAERWATRAPGGWPVARERAILERLKEFVRAHADCFERSCAPGHLTGSVLVVDSTWQRVLLVRHRKLNMWLQPGGHADGEAPMHAVARREAEEETGLGDLIFARCGSWLLTETRLKPQPKDRIDKTLEGAAEQASALIETPCPLPFDLDIHRIPARPGEPAHEHYDIRYLMQTDETRLPFTASAESSALCWYDLREARALKLDPSMDRMFDKVDYLRAIRCNGDLQG